MYNVWFAGHNKLEGEEDGRDPDLNEHDPTRRCRWECVERNEPENV